jgi:hypothetical protein
MYICAHFRSSLKVYLKGLIFLVKTFTLDMIMKSMQSCIDEENNVPNHVMLMKNHAHT